MDTTGKLKTLLSFAEECINESELRQLLESGRTLNFYDGFEPSGRMHIAQGLLRSMNVNKITSTGHKFIFYVADLFACLNHKLGGDMNKIEAAGKLMIEIWRASGMDMNNVQFVWASQEMSKRPMEYFKLLTDLSTRFTISRIKKCAPALGRDDVEELVHDESGNVVGLKSDQESISTLLYSVMQAADIPFLHVDVASLGVDQRKILVINREWSEKIKRKPPVLLMHHMLMGLDGSTKMAKSNPDAAIFMDDTEAEVNRKIKKAFCPVNVVVGNPIIDYVKHLILPRDGSITIGEAKYSDFETFQADYLNGKIHPGDLKPVVAARINAYLEPVRQHFRENEEARKLLERVKSFRVTK